MEEKFIQPFIRAVTQTFEVMLNLTPRVGPTSQVLEGIPQDVSAIIGLSGVAAGVVMLRFTKESACKVVSKLINEECTVLNDDVIDGVGEMVNIVAGNAKAGLKAHVQGDLALSLPNVVTGEHKATCRSQDMPCMVTNFEVEGIGELSLEVNFRLV